jgi:hypothetical protein
MRPEIVGFVMLAALATPAAAWQAPASIVGAVPRFATATRTVQEITVDGRDEDAAWSGAAAVSGFRQIEPELDADPSHQTSFEVVYDADDLYVFVRAFDASPDSILRALSRRDVRGPSDQIGVMIDSYHDRRTGFAFWVNPDGVKRYFAFSNDSNQDASWNGVWDVATTVDSLGWTAEFRIPLSQLRFASAERLTFGLGIRRQIERYPESSSWPPYSRTTPGMMSQLGTLDGLEGLGQTNRLEITPYVVTKNVTMPSAGGFEHPQKFAAGADVKLGITPNLTLDATVNPDFGQVEADPAVINLSAFETFFEERRPFFVEDARVFDFGLSAGGRLLYSRRVGRAPQGAAPTGALFTDMPSNATILGAAKLTGRTANGLSIGALAAVTGSEHGDALTPGDITGEFLVEPRAEFGAGSVVRDFRGGATQIGLLGTAMRRDLPSDGSFAWLPSSAFNGGVRFTHQWSDRSWGIFGYLAASHVNGDEAAITRIQRSSVHYFQRPDATRFALDPTATTIGGRDWRLTLEKRNGEHWTGSVWAAEVTKGFEVNDVGFSTRTEVLDGGAQISYREIRPGSVFRNYNLGVRTFHNWSHEALDDTWSIDSWQNARTGGSYGFNAFGQFLNYWGAGLNFQWGIPQMSRRQTRGGPMMVLPGSTNVSLNVSSDDRKAVSFGAFVGLNDARRGIGGGNTLELEMQFRPSDNLSLSVAPRYFTSRSGEQYVVATNTLPYAPTYGTRYLFADIEQRNFSMETRVDWTFSPTLSLQLYAQPLLSSGDYIRYKQLGAPETYDFVALAPTAVNDTLFVDFDGDAAADYSFTDRDFNVRSLIGNAVLRWEYRPGSTVFLVWQRAQDHEASDGDFDFSRDARELFGAAADDRFIVKVNYWLGL